MKHSIFYILFSFFLISCADSSKESDKSKNTLIQVDVKYYGALKTMMHKGDLSAQVKLSDFAKTKHLYGIGAFENLKGEIQIYNGIPYNTFVLDSAVAFDKSFDKKAALFVTAVVENWNSFEIPNGIKSHEQLEKHIALVAQKNNINVEEPFPFLINGTIESFDWHVINWKNGDLEHSHEKHVNSGLNGTIKNRNVELLGFYSNSHHTIFTHHTTNMHIHVKTTDNEIAGHVDGLALGEKMVLKLPASN